MDISYSRGLVHALIGLGNVKFARNDIAGANRLHEQAADLALKSGNHGRAAFALAWISRSLLVQNRTPEALATANRAIAESRNQSSATPRLFANLAVARVLIEERKLDQAQEFILSSIVIAQRDGYAPLALEGRILQTRTEKPVADRRLELNTLAREAAAHGWKRLAAEAHADRP
jgi:tetratricopeptide (TPR) repeat protein